MTDTILLPGSIPGLLRRGSPVRLVDPTGRAHATWWLDRATRGVPDHMAASCAPLMLDDDAREWTGAHMRHLDPHDDIRLPDGSRVVDALALRAVVLRVAGVTP